MKSFISNRWGRILILHLTKGEKLLESIQQETQRLGIQNAVVMSGIGAMRQVGYHYITTTEDFATNQYVTTKGPIELGSVQGLILDGEPHLHISSADPDRPFIGHLENDTEVQYLAEITIAEILDLNHTRQPDAFGIRCITEKE